MMKTKIRHIYVGYNVFDLIKNKPNTVAVVTTNCVVKRGGLAVMGAGQAKECAQRFPDTQKILGKYLNKYGNRAFMLQRHVAEGDGGIMSMPTKHSWRDKADIKLITKSCAELMQLADKFGVEEVAIPAYAGCGYGGLKPDKVQPIMEQILDERFHFIALR